jgi:PmbA protein
MDRSIIDALERHPQIHDWTIRRQMGRGAQVYLAGTAIENLRSVSRQAYEIEIFNDHQVDGEQRRGSAVIPLAGDEVDRLPEILDDAVTMAALVHNPPWTLPEPVETPDVELADPAIANPEQAAAVARDSADEIRDLVAAAGHGVRLSAAELFLTAIEEELHNSRGHSASSSSTRVLLELNLLADGEDEAEFFHQAECRRVADLRLPDLVAESSRLARDKVRAGHVTTHVGPVVFSGIALEQLLGPAFSGGQGVYMVHASAASTYARLSRFSVGEPVYVGKEPRGDLLNLASDARRPFAVQSYRFDADGLPAQRVPLIKDGVLTSMTATQRYAQYLGVPATGRAGMADIAPGSTHMAELLDASEPVLHAVAFSSANTESVTGNFGMELRMAYLIGPDGTRPVTGGSVTGNLFEAMANARFSSETAEGQSFVGPEAIRFEELQVAGEQT